MERAKDRDVVLGRTLAETAELNSPAVQRAGPDAERLPRTGAASARRCWSCYWFWR